MSIRFQRLLLLLLSIIFLTTAVLLILINSKKNLIFFYTPSEFINSDSQINDIIRIGGFVKKGSIKKKNNEYEFIITDYKEILKISYKGLLPDLFKEGQGAVIEGKLLKKNFIKATKVFAKHDENYIPASLTQQLKSNKYWKKEYE